MGVYLLKWFGFGLGTGLGVTLGLTMFALVTRHW